MARPIWAGLLSAFVLAFICAGLYAFTERTGVAKATLSGVSTIVGVDANPTGNTATSLGTIDRCVSVSPNSTFYIDLFVKDVTDLNFWEGALRFDGSIVKVTSLDVQYFLATTPGSDVSPYSDTIPNSSGSWLVSAFDYGKDPESGSGFPESGSGVLARVGLQAVKAGTSRLYFTWASSISGVVLRNDHDAVIGDLNGDTYFDGLVFNAIVVVDGPCPTDADKDGFTNVEESVDGSDLLNAASTPEVCDGVDNDLDGLTDEGYDRDPVNGIPDCVDPASDSDDDGNEDGAGPGTCNDGIDNGHDGTIDGNDPDCVPFMNPTETDDDNDGWVDAGPPVQGKASEAYLHTDSLADCAVNQYHSAWPLDIDNNRVINLGGDVATFVPLIGSRYGDGRFRTRLDLNGDHLINLGGDMALDVSNIGARCFL